MGKAKTIECKANEWTVLIKTMFVHIPADFHVYLTCKDYDKLCGVYEKRTGFWCFPIGKGTFGPLENKMIFYRAWGNDFFQVRIKPEFDITATVKEI